METCNSYRIIFVNIVQINNWFKNRRQRDKRPVDVAPVETGVTTDISNQAPQPTLRSTSSTDCFTSPQNTESSPSTPPSPAAWTTDYKQWVVTIISHWCLIEHGILDSCTERRNWTELTWFSFCRTDQWASSNAPSNGINGLHDYTHVRVNQWPVGSPCFLIGGRQKSCQSSSV